MNWSMAITLGVFLVAETVGLAGGFVALFTGNADIATALWVFAIFAKLTQQERLAELRRVSSPPETK